MIILIVSFNKSTDIFYSPIFNQYHFFHYFNKASSVNTFKVADSKDIELKIVERVTLGIVEPSDMCFSIDGQNLYIVSDKGRLHKADLSGNIIKTAKYKGHDFEGICARGNSVFVVDETLRMILEFDAISMKLKESYQFNYNGAMNRSWESIAFVTSSDQFISFTEKLPVLLFEFDHDMTQKGVHLIDDIQEISGATYYNDLIWVVSDEDRKIYTLNKNTYKVKDSWKIPVLNPEGITISPDGQIWILSDAMASIYKFEMPK